MHAPQHACQHFLTPTLAQVFLAPELATLGALSAVLVASLSAVRQANPNLLDDFPNSHCDHSELASLWLAATLIDQAEGILATISRYHSVVCAPPARPSTQDDDIF